MVVVGESMGEQVRYISLFSGVEACSVAWHHMDNWIPKVFAEFDAFPSAVLKHQFPHVPNVGDVTKHEWKQYEGQIELVVGGSPCQSFSVAGKRLGMDDPRGNLALHYLRIIDEVKPKWFIFENVPGLLSSDNGGDFATFLREVERIGYGCAYRVLDAQYFGVPQRRRRLFVVGHIDGDWRRAASVLFEPESLQGNNPPSRKKRQEAPRDAGPSTPSSGEYWNGRGIANTLTAKGDDDRMPDKGRFHGVIVPEVAGALDTDMNQKLTHQSAVAGHLIPTEQHPNDVSATVTAKWSKGADIQPGKKNGNMIPITVGVDLFNQEETGEVHVPLRTAQGHGAPAVMTAVQPVDEENICFDHTFGQNAVIYKDVSPTLKANGAVPTSPAVCQTPFHQAKNPVSKDDDTRWENTHTQPTLNTWVGHNETKIQTAVVEPISKQELAVRRLIPVECERLQGFPDNWTQIPWKKKAQEDCPDGPRFKAMGNSMAVPVMRWIGEGIELVNRIPRGKEDVPQQEELGWL